MPQAQQTSSVKRFFVSRLFLFIAIPLVLLIAIGYVRSYYSGYKINQEIAALESEIKSLESKKIESMEILKYVMSDDFVEEKARTELNMKKPGEQVLIVKNQLEYDDNRMSQKEKSTARQRISNPLKWWYYFTHRSVTDDQ